MATFRRSGIKIVLNFSLTLWIIIHKIQNSKMIFSYPGGRDQEDCGSKPAQGKQFRRSYMEKPIIKKGW
jgi:hypothetical protein